MIVGLGLGPTLVAVTKDRVYGAPSSVGLALSTVVAPAIAVCCLLFYIAIRALRRNQIAIA